MTIDHTLLATNAADVRIAAADGFTNVHFTPDPHGGPEALWFHFRLVPDPADRPARLCLEHFDNVLGADLPENVRPVVDRQGSGEFHRLPAPEIVKQPDGQTTLRWELGSLADACEVAFCYPYAEPEFETLVADTDGCWRVDTIGVSQGGRPIRRLSNDYGEVGGDRPGIYLLAGQHASETSGLWMLDGLLRELAREGANAPLVWAVPLTNIDGIAGGDYGKDNFPYDLNRAWGLPPMRHETLVLQRDMFRWRERCRPCLTLDSHSPGGCEHSGIYVHLPKGEVDNVLQETTERWAKRFAEALGTPFAADNFARRINYRSRWETWMVSQFVREQLGIVALSFETPYALIGQRVMTRACYQQAGALVAQALVRYCQ